MCVYTVNPLPGSRQLTPANVTANGTVVFGPVNGTFTTINVIQPVANTTTWCASILSNLTSWRQLQTNTTQQALIDLRLGDGRTTGSIASSEL